MLYEVQEEGWCISLKMARFNTNDKDGISLREYIETRLSTIEKNTELAKIAKKCKSRKELIEALEKYNSTITTPKIVMPAKK